MNGKGSYWFDYIHFGEWGGEVVSTIHRLNNNVPPITSHIPSDEKVFDPDTGLPDHIFIKDHFKKRGYI